MSCTAISLLYVINPLWRSGRNVAEVLDDKSLFADLSCIFCYLRSCVVWMRSARCFVYLFTNYNTVFDSISILLSIFATIR